MPLHFHKFLHVINLVQHRGRYSFKLHVMFKYKLGTCWTPNTQAYNTPVPVCCGYKSISKSCAYKLARYCALLLWKPSPNPASDKSRSSGGLLFLRRRRTTAEGCLLLHASTVATVIMHTMRRTAAAAKDISISVKFWFIADASGSSTSSIMAPGI